MTSAYVRLIALLSPFITAPEMTNLRLAIATGARGLATGRYTIEAVRSAAERICSMIEGAHIDSVRELEESKGISFKETCVDLMTRATAEEALRSQTPFTAYMEQGSESRVEERRGLKLVE
jgi:hypothetical protein